MVSPWLRHCIYIMHLEKMYKSFCKLSITEAFLQFYGTLGATLRSNLTKLACRLTTALDHFISFTLSRVLLEERSE